MRLRLLGHAAVMVSASSGARLLIDPYEAGGFGGKVAYEPIEERVDAVVCSHEHLDHCATHALPGAPAHVVEGRFGPFEIRRHRAWHDEYEGRRRGGAVDMLELLVDGARVVHASDVGQAPTPALVDALRAPDVLLVPTGGFYTIGAAQAWEWARRLGARCVIPLHYRTASCHFPIRGVAPFVAFSAAARVRRLDVPEVSVEVWERGGVVIAPMEYDRAAG